MVALSTEGFRWSHSSPGVGYGNGMLQESPLDAEVEVGVNFTAVMEAEMPRLWCLGDVRGLSAWGGIGTSW